MNADEQGFSRPPSFPSAKSASSAVFEFWLDSLARRFRSSRGIIADCLNSIHNIRDADPLMNAADIVPSFLAACPSMGQAWQQHLEYWGSEDVRGEFLDAGVIAHHLVNRFECGDLSEFPAAFAVLERCFVEGDEKAKGLASVGIIEDLQNIASQRPFGPWVFYEWLGPKSKLAWDELCRFWGRVAEAKAAGLLGTHPNHSPVPLPNPNQINDPTLRQMVESLYRKDERIE